MELAGKMHAKKHKITSTGDHDVSDLTASELLRVNSGGTAVESAGITASDAGRTDLYRQALINGNMDVWQRGTSFTPNDDTFTADRWNTLTESNGAWTISRSTDAPTGSKYSMKFVNGSANVQTALVYIMESEEAITMRGQTVSLSFYAKTTSSGIGTLRATVLSWTGTEDSVTSDVIGTWASDGTDPTWAASWTAEVAGSDLDLTDSWARYTVEGISLDTSSFNNLAVVIWVDDGTITSTDEWYISQVQLNVGSTALEFVPFKFADELIRCERYYRKSFEYSTAPAQNVGTTGIVGTFAVNTYFTRLTVQLPIPMRRTPTITTYNPSAANANWRNLDASSDGTAAVQYQCNTHFTLTMTTTSFTTGQFICIHYVADAEL